MKNRIMFLCSFLLVSVILSLSVLALQPATVIAESENSKAIITVSNNKQSVPQKDEILRARFLNMLNHSFVYDDSIYSVEEIVNQSVVALLSMRDVEDEDFIREDYVADYVYNMYGVEIESFEQINMEAPKKEGFVYIIPRGYSVYNHEALEMFVNEDGSYTFTTKVTVSSHDGGDYTDICTTLFVKNEASQFGFSIIRSDIGSPASAI